MSKPTYQLAEAATGQRATGHVFVNGNTRQLSDCSQQDLEVLHRNGDRRVIIVGHIGQTAAISALTNEALASGDVDVATPETPKKKGKKLVF